MVTFLVFRMTVLDGATIFSSGSLKIFLPKFVAIIFILF